MTNTFSIDHKHYYSNSVTLQINDNDCFVSFGLISDSNPADMDRQATVHMTHTSLKAMFEVVQLAIKNFEKEQGKPIIMPEGFIQKLEKAMQVKSSSNVGPKPA